MNYLYAADENYIRHAAASMASLCAQLPPGSGDRIHLLSLGVGEESLAKLQGMLARWGRRLETWKLGDLRGYFDFPVDPRGFSLSALGRLFLARALPAQVERVLYLDCDTILLADPSPLESLDMQGCPVAMVQEPTVRRSRLRELGLPADAPYYNSGVILFDLARWRREGVEGQVLDYYRRMGGALLAPDQDALNGALAGRICPLPPRYNFGSIQIYYPWAAQRAMCAPAPFYPTEAAYRQAAFPPAILHYLGEERPWRAGNRHPYREAYRQALAQTPWRDAPQEEGWRLYFRCFALFNWVTRPCPLLRWRIINGLIPAFMRYRAHARKKSHG